VTTEKVTPLSKTTRTATWARSISPAQIRATADRDNGERKMTKPGNGIGRKTNKKETKTTQKTVKILRALTTTRENQAKPARVIGSTTSPTPKSTPD